MRKDPNRAVCLVGLASRKNPLAAPDASATDKPPALKSTDKSTTPKKGGICKTFKKTGKCRFGDSCRFGHVASAGTPAAAANLPAAVTIQDPDEDQMGIDLEEFTCGADLGPGCTKTYKTCPSFWIELGRKKHKNYVTPLSCKYCRNIKRENWSNNLSPNTKVGSDGKPVDEVADLAMAALQPADEPFISDLDADDDDAMAGYASSIFSDLMMTIDQEELSSTTRSNIWIQNAANLFESNAASCAQFERDYGEPVPAPPEPLQNITMLELEPVVTLVDSHTDINAGAAPTERKHTQHAAAQRPIDETSVSLET